MPGKKIAFATSNFDEKSGKPASAPWDKVSYPEFNAMRSSSFNGLSIPYFKKLAFQEGSDKVKINYQEFGQPIPEPDGASKFIPVKILEGETMPISIAVSNESGYGCTFNNTPITGEVIGNNDFFPVGPGTPWIEVDIKFLSLLFWRVKKWKASAPGSMDTATLDGGYISTNTPGTDKDINELILISSKDPILASTEVPPGTPPPSPGDPPTPPPNVKSKNETVNPPSGGGEGIYESTTASFALSQNQVKNHIIRGVPAHFGACLKMTPDKNIPPTNGRYVLSIPGTGNTPTKYFINPTALYSLTCSYSKRDVRYIDFMAGCGNYSDVRSSYVSYTSSVNSIKQTNSSSSASCTTDDCPQPPSTSSSLSQSKIVNEGYTLNIKVGSITKTFTMPLSASFSSWTASVNRPYSADESGNCEVLVSQGPHLLTSLDAAPKPSFVVNLEADEFWEYDNGEGNPIYDKITGARLRDPITGE